MADLSPSSATEYGPSEWFGPYATNYLNRQQALSNTGFIPYSGQLTAGPSSLQTEAFKGIGSLAVPGGFGQAGDIAGNVAAGYGAAGSYDPTQFTTGRFNNQAAMQYMNPYLQSALDPQIREAQRAAEKQRMQDASRLTQAGAFGGSRQAIMESEGNRNLMTNISDILAKGYNTAYDKAADIFKSDEDRALEAARMSEASRQFGAGQGLKALEGQLGAAKTLSDISDRELAANRGILSDQLAAGATQRGITSEGLNADYREYMREFNYPQEQLDKMGAAIKNIPAYTTFASNTYGAVPNAFQSAIAGATTAAELLKILGLTPTTTTTTP